MINIWVIYNEENKSKHRLMYSYYREKLTTVMLIKIVQLYWLTLFLLFSASVAEGDTEEQSEVPKKKQKVSKKVQTRVYFYERIIRLHISLLEC